MKSVPLKRGLSHLARWWLPVAAIISSLIALSIVNVLGILLHGTQLETEIYLVSTVYFMTTASVLTVSYWLRYGQTGFRQDAVVSVAFFQLFLVSAFMRFYSLTVISNILIPNIATETLVILAVGIPRTVTRKRFGRKQLILLLLGPSLTSLAFLILLLLSPVHYLYSASKTTADLSVHIVAIVAAMIVVLEIRRLHIVQFSKSLTGLCIFAGLQSTGIVLHLLSGVTFDNAWWLSSIFIWLSMLFVAWGMLQDYRWFNRDLRGAFKIIRDGHSTLSSMTQREHASSVIELIPTVFEQSSVFCYTSMNGIDWELELEAMSYSVPMAKMPGLLNLTDSVSVLSETDVTISSSQNSDTASKLMAASGVPYISVIAKAPNGRYHMVGMRERDRVWWERAEITMLRSIATGIGFLAFQRETSVRQSRTVTQLLSMIHATDTLFSLSETDDLYDASVRLVSDGLGFENVAVWKVEGNNMILQSMAWKDRNLGIMKKGAELPPGRGMISQVAQTGVAMLANDVKSEQTYFDPAGSGTKSEYDAPIIHHDKVVAVLDIQSNALNAFNRLDTEVINSMTRLLSVAIETNALKDSLTSRGNLAEARAGLISHDLRNIFQPIRIYMQLLMIDLSKNSTVGANDVDYIRKTLMSIDTATSFLENTLKIMKLKAGSIASSTELNLSRIVEESANLIKLNFGSKNINFKFDIAKDAVLVKGNSLFGEIFSNLFSNSAKYCTGSAVEIVVKAERLNNGSEHLVRVMVSDNGGGISPDRRETLFHRFDTAAKGTGLGLSLVREIVESVDGKIHAEERVPGDYTQGTTFVIDLKSPT